jgi:hypothetical protein
MTMQLRTWSYSLRKLFMVNRNYQFGIKPAFQNRVQARQASVYWFPSDVVRNDVLQINFIEKNFAPMTCCGISALTMDTTASLRPLSLTVRRSILIRTDAAAAGSNANIAFNHLKENKVSNAAVSNAVGVLISSDEWQFEFPYFE